MTRPPPKREPVDLEAVRRMYVGAELTLVQIADLVGRTPGWVSNIAAAEGWPARGKDWRRAGKPKPATIEGTRTRRNSRHFARRSVKQLILDAKAADAARTMDLYGGNADDVTLLRRRGFVVHRQGAAYMVGNAACTADELRAKAARERRLERVAS